MFFKIGVLKNFAIFTGKSLCWSLFLIKLLKRNTNTGFSCEKCKIFKNTFFTEHLSSMLLSLSVIIQVIPSYYQKRCGSFLLFLDLIAFNLHFLRLLFDQSKINQNQNIYFNPLIQPPLSN